MIFYKYHGTGNDFIIIDNREHQIHLSKIQISFLCERHFGIGANGLILINDHTEGDFYMEYYNSDGSLASMCGNGGRCAVMFARQIGIVDSTECHFFAADGSHHATVLKDDTIALHMNVDSKIAITGNAYLLDTGSPHYVRFIYNLDAHNIKKEGRIVRNSAQFKREGINVNFVEETDSGLFVRTYERGVEDETLSCGTGVTAAALAMFHKEKCTQSKVFNVETLGGVLRVQIEVNDENEIEHVWLIGPAQQVFIGEIDLS